MKLSQAKRIAKLITESVGNNSLYRVTSLTDLQRILEGNWRFTPSEDEVEGMEDFGNPNVLKSEVYKKNKDFGFWKSLTRTVNPQLIEWMFNPVSTVIIEFDKDKLNNIRSVKKSPIKYDPYNDEATDEMEERLWSNSEYNEVPLNIISAIFITPQLTRKYKNVAKFIKSMDIPLYFLPEYKTLEEYARNINNYSLKRIREHGQIK